MALPTDSNVDFLVCDTARQEPDGKITLTGFYPTGEIKIDPTARLPVGLNLTFVFVLKDGEGEFRGAFRLYDPLGKELTHNQLPDIKKVAGQGQTVWIGLDAIPVLALGNYAVALGVGDGQYRRNFRVMQ